MPSATWAKSVTAPPRPILTRLESKPAGSFFASCGLKLFSASEARTPMLAAVATVESLPSERTVSWAVSSPLRRAALKGSVPTRPVAAAWISARIEIRSGLICLTTVSATRLPAASRTALSSSELTARSEKCRPLPISLCV